MGDEWELTTSPKRLRLPWTKSIKKLQDLSPNGQSASPQSQDSARAAAVRDARAEHGAEELDFGSDVSEMQTAVAVEWRS